MDDEDGNSQAGKVPTLLLTRRTYSQESSSERDSTTGAKQEETPTGGRIDKYICLPQRDDIILCFFFALSKPFVRADWPGIRTIGMHNGVERALN